MNDPKNSLKFPSDFEITPEWIENTNDALLLQFSLPLVSEKAVLKNLII
jgi:hypothetical protein